MQRQSGFSVLLKHVLLWSFFLATVFTFSFIPSKPLCLSCISALLERDMIVLNKTRFHLVRISCFFAWFCIHRSENISIVFELKFEFKQRILKSTSPSTPSHIFYPFEEKKKQISCDLFSF